MRISWIIVSVLMFILGVILTVTIIGAVIGIPLILLSIVVFILGILIPGRFLRMVIRIALVLLLIWIVFTGVSFLFEGGKDFWKQKIVVPVLKPFSEPCGESIPMMKKEECECEGTLLVEKGVGLTNYYCYGKCGECVCFEFNQTTQEDQEIDC